MYGYIRQIKHIRRLVQLKKVQNLGQYMNQVSIFNGNNVTINMTNPNGNLSNMLKLKFKYLKKLRTSIN